MRWGPGNQLATIVHERDVLAQQFEEAEQVAREAADRESSGAHPARPEDQAERIG